MKESLFQEICFLFTFRSVYFYPKTIINYFTTPNTIPVAGCLHKLLAIAPLYKTSTAPHCVPHAGIFIYLSFSLVCVCVFAMHTTNFYTSLQTEISWSTVRTVKVVRVTKFVLLKARKFRYFRMVVVR